MSIEESIEKSVPNVVCCKECKRAESYKHLYTQYNKFVTEHNILVDMHESLTGDANSLLKFVEDIAGMLRENAVGIITTDNQQLKKIEIPAGTLWDSNRQASIDLYNNIVTFMELIKEGVSASVCYAQWKAELSQALQIKQQQGGM
jgi:hypothetical protein